MHTQWQLLWSDALLFVLVITFISLVLRARQKPHLRRAFQTIFTRPAGMISGIILFTYLGITVLDSIHFRVTSDTSTPAATHRPIQSSLDRLLMPLPIHNEKTYSKPFARTLYSKETLTQPDGSVLQRYPTLYYGGQHLHASQSVTQDVINKSLQGLGVGLLATVALALLIIMVSAQKHNRTLGVQAGKILYGHTALPWRSALLTVFVLVSLIASSYILSRYYHILGTDKVGTDVFFEAVKSIRTGMLIGTLTTLVMLPFAIILGTSAGFFGGKLDDAIQYLYTTLSSVPGVLLIAAAILSLQVVISQHPELFPSLIARADARLIALCVILGITSWTGLCRLLRAETLKVRELDYVNAARSLGTPAIRIMLKHILPNTLHIVIISVILDFSSLVLAEAVLSYIGIGVDPTTISWGNMINAARLEMAREPIVWWPLLAAFSLMFTLVLCANFFSDAVRDGFDPRLNNA